jgi:hypothetical protein
MNVANEGPTVTTAELRDILRVGTLQAAATQMRRWGVQPVGTVSGSTMKLWPENEVRHWLANRPRPGVKPRHLREQKAA